MPNNTLDCPINTWTLLTSVDSSSASLATRSPDRSKLFVVATSGATPPTDDDGAFPVGNTPVTFEDIATVWPGVTGANRLYGRPSGPVVGGSIRVTISYA